MELKKMNIYIYIDRYISIKERGTKAISCHIALVTTKAKPGLHALDRAEDEKIHKEMARQKK
jgi:hypothetical protein